MMEIKGIVSVVVTSGGCNLYVIESNRSSLFDHFGGDSDSLLPLMADIVLQLRLSLVHHDANSSSSIYNTVHRYICQGL